MRTLELFAGAGGAALGLKSAGCEAVACYEWDKDACDALTAAGFPGLCMDVRKARWEGWATHYGTPDLMWASPPCQAFSQAGDRLGAKDPRNGWPWTLDCIDAVKPIWAICENVPGLTQHSTESCGDPMACPGCYWLREVVPAFESRFAFVHVWKLNAADYGVPQTRNRVFLVAGPAPVRPPEKTHAHPGECHTLFGELKPWVSMGEALGMRPFVMDGCRNTEANPTQERPRDSSEPAPTLSGNGGQVIVGGGHNPNHSGDLRRYRDLTDGPSTTISTEMSGNGGPFVVSRIDRPSPTVVTSEVKGSGKGASPHKMQRASDALYLGTGRRRLTVAECAKLQDFPDGHPFQGTKTSQYRQVGNAVPPKLAEVVASAVVKAHQEYTQ